MKDEIIIVLLIIVIFLLFYRRVSFATPEPSPSPAPAPGGPDVNNPFKLDVGIKSAVVQIAFKNLFNDIASYLKENCLTIEPARFPFWTVKPMHKRTCPFETTLDIRYIPIGPVTVKTITTTHLTEIKRKLNSFLRANVVLFGFGDAATNANNPYRAQWNRFVNSIDNNLQTPMHLQNILQYTLSYYPDNTLHLFACDRLWPRSIPDVMAQNVVWHSLTY